MKKLIIKLINSITPSDYVFIKKGEISNSKEFFDEVSQKVKDGVHGFRDVNVFNGNAMYDASLADSIAEDIGADVKVRVLEDKKYISIDLCSGYIINVSTEHRSVNYHPSTGLVVSFCMENKESNALGFSIEDAVKIASGLPEMQK